MTAAIDAARARAAPLLEPFEGSGGGRECRDDPRAQWIGDAMLVEPIVRRPWPRILTEGEALLREVGKDLRIAGIWAAAAFECEGLAGLAAGLATLAGLLRERWDDLQPARARARENALANYYEHLAIRLPARTIDAGDGDGDGEREALAACERLLDELHAAAADRFAPPPMPRQARAELARLRASLPAPAASEPGPTEPAAPEPRPPAIPKDPGDRSSGTGLSGQARSTPAPPADPAPGPGPAAASPAPTLPPAPQLQGAGDDDEVQRFVAGLSQGMIKAAAALRRRSAADPLAYRLLRIGAWVRAARPSEAGGRTPLAGLRADTRQSLEAMRSHGKWAALVDAAEAAFARPEARFHLDLHRYTLAALDGLGDDHRAARAAVLGELAGLLRRMPGLLALADREGAPLADAATRELLAREGLVAGAGSAGPIAAPTPTGPQGQVSSTLSFGPADAPLAAAIEAARARASAGDPAGAIALLQAEVDRAASPRARFLARVALAERCRELGLAPLAASIFAALGREARDRDLAAWEPALCVPVLVGLVTTPGPAADEVARAFAELCLLDPGAALRIAAASSPLSPAR